MLKHEGAKRLCRVLAGMSLIGMVAVPLIVAVIWLAPSPVGIFPNADPALRLAAFGVAMASAAVRVAALWFLRRVFLEGAAGRWFSLPAVRNFRRFAWATLALVFIRIAEGSATSVILSLPNPPGERAFSIAAGSVDIGALFTALLMLFVAHIFVVGREADEEAAAFL
jgi:hypothetical protein